MSQICKIRDLQRAVAQFEQTFESRYGICLNEGMALCILHDAHTLVSGELCRRLELSPSNTSKVLKALETKGLLRRGVGDKDRRQMYVTLTGDGEALIARLHGERLEVPALLRNVL